MTPSRPRPRRRLTAAVSLALAGIAAPRPAHAVNVQQYSRSNSLTFEMLEDARIENSHVYSDFDSIVTLGASYVDEPLVVKNGANGRQTDALIPSMKNLHFGAGWYARDWLQLGATANYSFFTNNLNESRRGFNDVELKTKFRVLKRERDAFSVMPTISLPSKAGEMRMIDSSGIHYGTNRVLSDDGVGYGGRFIYERVFRSFQLVANVGYVRNPKAVFVDTRGRTQIDYRERFVTGAGVYLPLFARAGFNAEFLKVWTAPLFNDRLNPTEMHVGFSTAISEKAHFFAGVNFGNLLSTTDGNDYRLVAGLKITPHLGRRAAEAEAAAPEKRKRVRIVENPPLDCRDVFPFREGVRSFTVPFARGSQDLGPRQADELARLVRSISPALGQIEKIVVQGHASPEAVAPRHSYTNEGLAEGRAQAVKSALEGSWSGASHPPIETESFGAARPLGSELDRRAEIIVHWRQGYEACSSSAP